MKDIAYPYICIARSNQVSLSNLDVHLMGQVQVIDEDIIHGGFVYSTTHLPLLSFFFFETRHECYSPFSFFSGGCSAVFAATFHGF